MRASLTAQSHHLVSSSISNNSFEPGIYESGSATSSRALSAPIETSDRSRLESGGLIMRWTLGHRFPWMLRFRLAPAASDAAGAAAPSQARSMRRFRRRQ
jgi:hypothetical protein